MKQTILITGGAGFIGINLADRLLEMGESVLILDNLSRAGVERNLMWLRQRHNGRYTVEASDVRDFSAVLRCVKRAQRVYHLAAQVGVSASLKDPLFDFEINAKGTLHVLEAIRSLSYPVPILFCSTSKVYGALDDIPLRENGFRYEPYGVDSIDALIDESRPLDLHTPYGCSKGAADQYVRDYSRTYGIPAVVFRTSCVYGPRQLSGEDYEWLATSVQRALAGLPVYINGDGMQVTDVLFVDDLVDAMITAMHRILSLSGEAFNIGGGPDNAVSQLEMVKLIREVSGVPVEVQAKEFRPGHQRYYVSNISKFQERAEWSPRIPVREGIRRLCEFVVESINPAAGRKYATVRA